MARLRFSLRDITKTNKNALEDIDKILVVVCAGKQYMIILGSNLLPTYSAVVKDFDLTTEKTVNENLDNPANNKLT
ncbi:hypothetical protein [Lactobacillus sp. ESL0230]|uniref:hypothetical protein n=1 Tax=Lactobacillus sp. ESL0230 TaxID=2069353 RepID=UPI001313DC06|nr:hypothetical protein [Lactobacillus sp. ESL0230]